MRICEIRLKNFRGISEGHIVLPQHGVLLGANNAGKTTVVEALALLFGRERMVGAISDWDFYQGSPKPDSRFTIVATLTGFSSNDPAEQPEWFAGEHAAQPVWWDNSSEELCLDTDAPPHSVLATQVAVTGRFDDEACEFEIARYFYHGEIDPFTDGFSPVTWRLLREVGVFLLSSKRDWDHLLSFRSSSLLKALREYNAVPGRAVDELKEQLRKDVAKIEEQPPLAQILETAERELRSFMMIPESSKLAYRPTSLDAQAVLQSLVAHIAETDGSLIPIARQGAGVVSLQAFLLLLAFAKRRRESFQNFILAAEEPELHLHPSLHHLLVNRIRSASDQSIVTTQSPQVAAGYQPHEAVFLSKEAGNLTAQRLRKEPIREITRNSVRGLYLIHRAALYEALMATVILVPEGKWDFEWLTLWQRVAQSLPESTNKYDLRPIAVVPTSDAAVVATFQEVAKFRPDAVPVVDGDKPGADYAKTLLEGTPKPRNVVRLGDAAGIETLSAWILEPSLVTMGPELSRLMTDSEPSFKGLRDALSTFKKDQEAHEKIAWEAASVPACAERMCGFLRDLGLIAAGRTPLGQGWTIQRTGSGINVLVAAHVSATP